ncbi:MAG TPA: leucyl/phenylalanyl-tRNA--protein transferase [Lacipirellulaceae bacterium]|jgi:leucyl/phenylalanyl-tRNA--protein transferase|nr:leucyl/phenylalanyl-tRNA--protein transferase [Lacipirellulaceae bacterium]
MLDWMEGESNEIDELFVPFDTKANAAPPIAALSPPRFFPPPTATTPDGLLCVGGRLTPEWLLDAYRHGIFPWPMWENDPIAWWSPDPRAVIELDGLHVSRRLQRRLRSGKFRVTSDRDFAGIIHGCATAGDRQDGTWLLPQMISAYREMHRLGHAHSIEVWSSLPLPSGEGRGKGEAPRYPDPNSLPKGEGMRLVGGTYGIAIGGLFAAESMFHHVTDASKVAVAHLVAHLRNRGYELLDIQQWTPHTGTLGAVAIPRRAFLERLARAVNQPITFGELAADTG